jgi:4-hydroxy-L-threonine phosphate dehydrogenase PdxA
VRIAITLGDPNGIGPEIAIKAAARFADNEKIRPVLVGDGFVIEDTARRLGLAAPEFVEASALEPAAFAPGTLDPRAGKATVAYAAAAVKLAQEGKVDAIIGCPHSETAVNRAGIEFSGYGGLLADLTGTPRDKVFMMLVAKGLRIAHATLHESVSTALDRLTPDLVVSAAEAVVATAQRLGIARPSLGVFGINPHAGEDGLFGDDDERITKPAVARLKQKGHRGRRSGRCRPVAEPAPSRFLSRHVPRPGPYPDQASVALTRFGAGVGRADAVFQCRPWLRLRHRRQGCRRSDGRGRNHGAARGKSVIARG